MAIGDVCKLLMTSVVAKISSLDATPRGTDPTVRAELRFGLYLTILIAGNYKNEVNWIYCSDHKVGYKRSTIS